MFGLTGIQTTIIAFAIGMTIGAASGYYTKAKFFKAEQVDRITEVRKADAKSVQDSQVKGATLEKAVTASSDNIDQIKGAVKKYENLKPKSKPKSEEAVSSHAVVGAGLVPPQNDCPVHAATTLNFGTVWLLNTARQGIEFDSATAPGNEEGGTPTAITGSDLIQNDLEIVKRYHNLGKIHNALVDYVEELQREQRESMGLK